VNETPRPAYADDLRIGRVYPLGSYVVSEDELVDFARQWDPQSFHVDAAAAASGAFGGLIASGIHTLAIFQRLAVQGAFADWQVIAGRRLVDVEFRRPVRPGDTLTGSMTIDDIVVDDRGRALVTAAAALVDQDERTVLTTVIEVLVRARP
jgi:acyl dehydratase